MTVRTRERRPRAVRDPTIRDSIEELAARFAGRTCAVCDRPACTVLVGQEEVREAGILLRRPMEDRNLCLQCALGLPTWGNG